LFPKKGPLPAERRLPPAGRRRRLAHLPRRRSPHPQSLEPRSAPALPTTIRPT
jgi:hypothetical protein